MERRLLYGGVIAGSGLLLTALQLVQGFQQLEGFEGTDRGTVFAFETLPFVVIGLTLVYVGYWLSTQLELESELGRVVAWGTGSVVLFTSIAALLMFSLQVTLAGDTLAQAPFVVVNLVTVGALTGVLVGVYDAQSRIRQRELQRQRDRVEQFARKAADVNNYGRELNRSESVDQVSSLCLQALQTFLGLTHLSFAVTDGAQTEFVADTTVGFSEDALTALIQDSLDDPPATVTVHDSLPRRFDSTADGAITMLITRQGESAIVMVALTDDHDVLGEEDVQLLEMLVAHAATALDRISEDAVTEEPSH